LRAGLARSRKNFARRFLRDIKLQAAVAETGIGGSLARPPSPSSLKSIPHQRLPFDPLKKK
jgi:hypothetical protein